MLKAAEAEAAAGMTEATAALMLGAAAGATMEVLGLSIKPALGDEIRDARSLAGASKRSGHRAFTGGQERQCRHGAQNENP